MKRALITGVGGFCGRHLAARLNQSGDWRVAGVDLAPTSPNGVVLDQYLQADLRDYPMTAAVIRQLKPDYVYHLAGLFRGNSTELHQANLGAGTNLLDAVHSLSPNTRVLIVGSAAEYGRVPIAAMPISEEQECVPVSDYGRSKHAMTGTALDYVRRHGLRVVIARPFNIVGPGVPPSLVAGALLERVKKALSVPGMSVIEAGNLDSKRDFIAVQDVADAYVDLLEGEFWGEIFNICSGEPRSIRSIGEELLSFADRPLRLTSVPRLVRSDDPETVYGSWRKANEFFGFRPRTAIRDALMAAWLYL